MSARMGIKKGAMDLGARAYKYRVPGNIADIVCAVFADHVRREQELARGELAPDVLAKYGELSAAVELALECVEENIRKDILCDIAEGRGYEASMLAPIMAKNTYYERKREVICGLARILTLI